MLQQRLRWGAKAHLGIGVKASSALLADDGQHETGVQFDGVPSGGTAGMLDAVELANKAAAAQVAAAAAAAAAAVAAAAAAAAAAA